MKAKTPAGRSLTEITPSSFLVRETTLVVLAELARRTGRGPDDLLDEAVEQLRDWY